MAVRLLADECIQDKLLVNKLRAAGHDVVTALLANVIRVPDAVVFNAAIADNRIVLTINCIDFVDLSIARINQGLTYPGIFLLYQQNDANRDMTYDQIVTATANLEATQVPLVDTNHVLNQYNY